MHHSISLLTILAAVFWITLNCMKNPVGPDVNAVTADERELVITYAPGDSAGSVTGNVFLPASGLNGSSVGWVTSDNNLITIEGIVSRPAASSGDASVTLTATISKGKASIEKLFSVRPKSPV